LKFYSHMNRITLTLTTSGIMKSLYSTSGIMKKYNLKSIAFYLLINIDINIYINRHFVFCFIIFHFVSINKKLVVVIGSRTNSSCRRL
jgi:hypothetical protein